MNLPEHATMPTPLDMSAPPAPPEGEPPLWPEIRGIIEHDIASQPRSLQRELGPSEIGTDCPHCLAAKLAGWEQLPTPGWLPFIGTCVHEHFERLFSRLSHQPEYLNRWRSELAVDVAPLYGIDGSGYDIHGHIDLWDQQAHATCDWKIVGDTTLRQVKAHGPSQTYLTQASLYGLGLTRQGETVRRSCIYYLPRNAMTLDKAIPWEQPFDPKPGKWAINRLRLLRTLLDIIEQAEGREGRDQWISLLPRSSSHCFDCATWADTPLVDGLPNKTDTSGSLPERWTRLIPLIQPDYQPTTSQTAKENQQ